MTMIINHNRSIVLERPVISYWTIETGFDARGNSAVLHKQTSYSIRVEDL